MGGTSAIEWTDATWSPVTGCTRISDGCLHCYIARTPPIRMAGRKFDGPGIGATLAVQLHPTRLDQPLRWKKPRKIFVCSQADLFHDDVPDEYIARVWAVMALAPQHTFQVLTKRPARMRALLNSRDFYLKVMGVASAMAFNPAAPPTLTEAWPLPNVWLGVSTENQKWADIRIPALLDTPAAVRWVSAEPLVGPLDLGKWVGTGALAAKARDARTETWADGLAKASLLAASAKFEPTSLDWVVVGGESGGSGARPMHPDWARALRDQCTEAGTPFLLKQWGSWVGHSNGGARDGAGRSPWYGTEPTFWVRASDGLVCDEDTALADGGSFTGMWRVGAKDAGRELDGQIWDQYPRQGSRR